MCGAPTPADGNGIAPKGYRGYRMRSETPEYLRVLTGIAESQNAKSGEAVDPPILIGDQEKAAMVLQRGKSTAAISFARADPKVMAVTYDDK